MSDAFIKSMARKLVGWPPLLFMRRLVSDSTLGLSEDEKRVLGRLRIGRTSIYGDRFAELRRFWRKSRLSCLLFFRVHGWPFSERLRGTLMKAFEGNVQSDRLFETYARTSFHYSAMLMLSMHRGQWLAPFLQDMGEIADTHVLDYGCGVSDMGLILAQMGAHVTIVDLAGRKLDFAEWRYRIRSLACDKIGMMNTEELPALSAGKYDLAIATKILEHVRNPLALLEVLTESLRHGAPFAGGEAR